MNNAKRVIDADDTKRVLYKEAMYLNMLAMGERGELKLYDSDDIKASLRTIMIEENGKMGGVYDHIANGLMRGCWLAKSKPLNFNVYRIKV